MGRAVVGRAWGRAVVGRAWRIATWAAGAGGAKRSRLCCDSTASQGIRKSRLPVTARRRNRSRYPQTPASFYDASYCVADPSNGSPSARSSSHRRRTPNFCQPRSQIDRRDATDLRESRRRCTESKHRDWTNQIRDIECGRCFLSQILSGLTDWDGAGFRPTLPTP